MTPTAGDGRAAPSVIRDEIVARLRAAAGERVRAIHLFGSRARGTARPRSDWDIAVVLSGEVDDWAEEMLRLGALFYQCDFAVDLHVFGEQEFARDAVTPGTLAFTIRKSGAPLYVGE